MLRFSSQPKYAFSCSFRENGGDGRCAIKIDAGSSAFAARSHFVPLAAGDYKLETTEAEDRASKTYPGRKTVFDVLVLDVLPRSAINPSWTSAHTKEWNDFIEQLYDYKQPAKNT